MSVSVAKKVLEISASLPRCGAKLMQRAIESGPESSNPLPDLTATSCKTHSPSPQRFAGVRRAIFLFGDPVAAVLSTRANIYTSVQFSECEAGHLDPNATDILGNDAMNFERIFDRWMRRQTFDLICVRYETLWENIGIIDAFFGRHLFLPPKRDRTTKIEYSDPTTRRIQETYSNLIHKVAEAPDIAIHRAKPTQPTVAVPVAKPRQRSVCPICGALDSFVEFRGRKDEQCSNCKSLLRTRAMYLALKHLGRLPNESSNSPTSILHFAPERSLYHALTKQPKNVSYLALDVEPKRYSFAQKHIKYGDICELHRYAKPGKYNVVI
ncbi:MAG: hypothetical protein AAFX07_16540, partial [Pseudomonadota bacterium]